MEQINSGLLFSSYEELKTLMNENKLFVDCVERLRIAFEAHNYSFTGMYCWRSVVVFRPDMKCAFKITCNNGVHVISTGVRRTMWGPYVGSLSYTANEDNYIHLLPHAHRPFKLMQKSNLHVRKFINALAAGDFARADALEMALYL